MNYVVYWDIFRDYLTEGKVPDIPWARTFQRDPASALRVIDGLSKLGQASTAELAANIGFKQRPCLNILSDLVALQLVDRVADDLYRLAAHLDGTSAVAVAPHARRQLQRHVVFLGMESSWERGAVRTIDEWDELFAHVQPRNSKWSQQTLHYYGANIRRWLTFAGLLEIRGARLVRRPVGTGSRMGLVTPRRALPRMFLGNSTPSGLCRVVELVGQEDRGVTVQELVVQGLRNALSDAAALGLVVRSDDGRVVPVRRFSTNGEVVEVAKIAVMEQETITGLADLFSDRRSDDSLIGGRLRRLLRADHWKPDSARRYAAGLRRFYLWASDASGMEPVPGGSPR